MIKTARATDRSSKVNILTVSYLFDHSLKKTTLRFNNMITFFDKFEININIPNFLYGFLRQPIC